MRICIINPGVVHALPRTIHFAKYFDEVHYIDIIGMDNRESVEENGIFYYSPFADGNYKSSSARLQKLFCSIDPDGIVCHFAHGMHMTNSLIYDKCPVGVIAMGHDVLYGEGDGEWSFTTQLLIQMQLRRVDYISAKSGQIKERVHAFGVKAPVEVNYWGADLERFAPASQRECRERLSLPPAIPIILSPRAIEPRLNIHLIVEALPEVRKAFPEVKLLLIGRSDREYHQKVEHLISEFGLSESVEWRHEVGYEEMQYYINASDVAISVARSDGFSNTVLEVFACCVPVILGEIPQIKELAEGGHNATICQISATAIAEAVIEVLSQPALSATMAVRGYETVQQFGDIKKSGERFAKAFKDVIATQGKRRKGIFTRIPLFGALLVDKVYNKIKGRIS